MKNFLKAIFAPFVIVKREKLYIGWIIYAIFFGMLNFLADTFMGNFESITNYISSGQFYTFSIALCAPFIIDLLLSIIVGHRSDQGIHFLKYKITTISITIILLCIMTFLWMGKFKGILILQIILTLISLFLSYYMFLVGHMQEHIEVTSKYDDKEYLKLENDRIEAVQNKTSTVSEVDMKGEKVSI